MALTLPQQQMHTIPHSAQCFRVVLFEALASASASAPRRVSLAYPGSASPQLLARHYHPRQPTNPQRVTLSTHPHHYPHIFLAVVEPSVSVYETPAPLMLFVHQSSLKPASQYRKYVCSLSLSNELQWEKAVTVLSFYAEKWLMCDIHSAFVKPVKYPTPHLLDLNGRLQLQDHSFPHLKNSPAHPATYLKHTSMLDDKGRRYVMEPSKLQTKSLWDRC